MTATHKALVEVYRLLRREGWEGSDPDEWSDLGSLIAEVFDDADFWLGSPNAALGGRKPLDLIGSPSEKVVRELVRAIKIGMPT
jgi:hypothetical protein